MIKPKILLLSAYDAESHQYWWKLLKKHLVNFDWTVLTLPARHFHWRMKSNALTFANQNHSTLSQSYDLLIATSMVDLATLRGFVPRLAKLPTLVYFHENQFVYPVSKDQPNVINTQVTSLFTALCADRVVFNSRYNQSTFLGGVRALSKRLPDGISNRTADEVAEKSQVLAVPIDFTPRARAAKFSGGPPVILWNHRWEYDKQPEIFFLALHRLRQQGIKFKLHLLGQSFRDSPACFLQAQSDFHDEILTLGYQSRETYLQCLVQSDIVVSCAAHEFQGISLLEAIHAGCSPVVPDRLVYPEYVPPNNRYQGAENAREEAENLSNQLILTFVQAAEQKIDLNRYSATELLPLYEAMALELIG